MTSAFTDVLHVANLTTGSHLMSILTQSDAFSKVFFDDDDDDDDDDDNDDDDDDDDDGDDDDDDDDIANFNTGSHLMSILTQSDAFSKVFYHDDNDDYKIQRFTL